MDDLKERTIRGGLAKLLSQTIGLALQLGSLMILARLLNPNDFGLVAMVTAITGALNLFRDFGLSTAAIQRETVSEAQISTLFWINLLVGLILSCIVLASAPAISAFYHEPRLLWLTVAVSTVFLINSIGIQHSALLQRQMRFSVLAGIEVGALAAGVTVGICMALLQLEYWALVGMTLTRPAIHSALVWIVTGWKPGLPRRHIDIGSMMMVGGTLTLNGLVVYIAYNLEKVLLGKFWGADALGVYGRAYQLINIPTDSLNSSVGGIALAALSRLRGNDDRFRVYFLKGYSILIGLTIPITVLCALFSDQIVFVILGSKWSGVAEIFRLLTPTILVFGMINPFFPLMISLNKQKRSLRIALVLSPLVIGGYAAGLPYGPRGVAICFSTVMTMWLIPHILWCVQGTGVSLKDIMTTITRPIIAALVAAILAQAFISYWLAALSDLSRLLLGIASFSTVYAAVLLAFASQRELYSDVFRVIGLSRRAASTKETSNYLS
jgi:PST family polysaccharide transporter